MSSGRKLGLEDSIGFHAAQMRPIDSDPSEPYNKVMVGGLKRGAQEPSLTYR